MQPTSSDSILSAIQTLANQQSMAIPTPVVPSLNYTAPSNSDISSQFQQFLTQASNDPDIVNYYNQLLQQSEYDTTIAENYLEQDYQTGTRNTIQNLQGTLAQLGQTFQQENQQQQDTLNQRGIALTQGPNGQLTYGGGGEANTEIGQTQQSQALRQEAEQRRASQTVTGLSQSLQQGLTSAGESLTQNVENLQQEKNTDILNRANMYSGIYQGEQQTNANNAATAQSNQNLANQAKGTNSTAGTSTAA